MKKLLILVSLLFFLSSNARVKIGDLYYNLDDSNMIAEVASLNYDNIENDIYVDGDLSIPENVSYNGATYSVTSIGNNAFYNCSGLTSVEIPNSVTSIGVSAFWRCSNLTKVEISDLEAWCKIKFEHWASNPLYYAHHLYLNGEEINDLKIPDSITSIEDYAFDGCSGLSRVEISNSVTTIGDYAFRGCSGLRDVVISNSVKSIGSWAFEDCSGLRHLTMGNSVTNIGNWTFSGCKLLTRVEIPSSVTRIGSCAFSDCRGLSRVEISDLEAWCKINFLNIESNPLYNAHHLYLNGIEIKDLKIPESITSIKELAFYDCSGLKSVEIPNSVTCIGKSAFQNCSGLTGELKIPEGVESIEEKAFYRCSGITLLDISNSVTSIGNSAFSGCSKLTYLFLGENVSEIGDYAFDNCLTLDEILSFSPIPPMGNKDMFYSWSYKEANLFVPEGSVDIYKKQEPWCNFFSIKALGESGVEDIVGDNETLPQDVYNLNGMLFKRNATQSDLDELAPGIYIIGGKKYIVK